MTKGHVTMAAAGVWPRLALVVLVLAAVVPGGSARAALSSPGSLRETNYVRTVERYEVPDVILINQHREKIRLRELLLNAAQPVLLDFIYGTCTTICPILSAGYANLQRKLDAGAVRLVSISIDPEYDTPDVMTDYLRRYQARPGWDFLTGSRADIDKVMRAFNAYVPNKMSHYPMTLLHAPGEENWVRIYGLIGTSELMAEYQKLKR